MALAVPALSAQASDAPPVWYQNRTLAYPERDFISATGSGYSAQAARDNALETLALYFDAHVAVERTASLSGSDGAGGSSKQRSVSAATSVSADTDLPSVQFSDSFYNAARREYAVCAYIDRSAAVSEYSARLAGGIADSLALVERAELEAQPYAAYGAASRALGQLSALAKAAQYLSVLDGARGADSMRSLSSLAARAEAVRAKAKPRLTFGVSIQGDDGSAAQTVRALLESRGFSSGAANPAYAVTGEITLAESQNTVGVFVRPSLTLTVTARDGTVVGSYSRQYPKYGHNNLDGARAKARVEIEKDMKARLLDALF